MTHLFFLILVFVCIATPASAQLGTLQPPGDFRVQGGPGDFRVQGGPGAAPTVGLPGGPSLPAGPTLFRDLIGTKDSQDILSQINKDLGSRTVGGTSSPFGGRTFELPQGLGSTFEASRFK